MMSAHQPPPFETMAPPSQQPAASSSETQPDPSFDSPPCKTTARLHAHHATTTATPTSVMQTPFVYPQSPSPSMSMAQQQQHPQQQQMFQFPSPQDQMVYQQQLAAAFYNQQLLQQQQQLFLQHQQHQQHQLQQLRQQHQQTAQTEAQAAALRRPRSRSRSLSCAAKDDDAVPMSPRMSGATSTMVELAKSEPSEPLWLQLNQSMHNYIDTTVATSAEDLSDSDVDVIRRAFLAGARNGIELGEDDSFTLDRVVDEEELLADVGEVGDDDDEAEYSISSTASDGEDRRRWALQAGDMKQQQQQQQLPKDDSGEPVNLGILLHAAQTVASFRGAPVQMAEPLLQLQPQKRSFADAEAAAATELGPAVFKRLRSVLLAR